MMVKHLMDPEISLRRHSIEELNKEEEAEEIFLFGQVEMAVQGLILANL